jgi:adenine-specific DNA-methyltransferase
MKVPAEIQTAISSWTQWIDYWAIDWDNRDDTFHNKALVRAVTH